MAEWQEQLNHILSDPETMAQIASLAQSLTGPPDGAGAPPGDGDLGGAETPPRDEPPRPPQEGGIDAEALRSMLGGLDPELLRRLMPLIRQMNRPESSEATALLTALRPFLSEKRRGKVERAAQLARLIHLGKTFLTAQGQEAERV